MLQLISFRSNALGLGRGWAGSALELASTDLPWGGCSAAGTLAAAIFLTQTQWAKAKVIV